MQRIEIYDRDEAGALAPDLGMLLRLVEKYQSLRWYLVELEAIGQLRGPENMLELEKHIASSPWGIEFDWDTLNALAKQITQVINMTLAGCRRDQDPPSKPLRSADVEVVIKVVDSTFCVVSTRDPELVSLAQRRFSNTKLIS